MSRHLLLGSRKSKGNHIDCDLSLTLRQIGVAHRGCIGTHTPPSTAGTEPAPDPGGAH
ncbi:hypothetical protein RHRU231_570002 [Rhodococcus ruber]|uniref:Uncharacterized protein n=1 Tax=Rhodococcus ruber TaxID=1830 RepID=A0A098BQ77_9NOCA|nr:hypothetical protein RHRU231_570002 [Rhodococcus ruber]